MLHCIEKPWSITFSKYGKTNHIVNTKTNIQSLAKSLRRLDYNVKVKALKKKSC